MTIAVDLGRKATKPTNQQTKFGIPEIYARDMIFLDLMVVVKVRDAL